MLYKNGKKHFLSEAYSDYNITEAFSSRRASQDSLKNHDYDNNDDNNLQNYTRI